MSRQFNNALFTFSILFIAPLSSIGIDLYTPSLPAITHIFHTSHFLAKQTLSLYLLGMGLGICFFGCLSDQIGRKKPLQTSLIFYLFSSIMIVANTSIHLFLCLRFLQGFFVGGIAAVSRTMLVDLYKGEQFKHVFTRYVSIWSLGPIIAPFVGGYLQAHIGWHGAFFTLSVYGLIATILFFFNIKETLPLKQRVAFKQQQLALTKIITTPIFIIGLFTLISGYSFIVIFNVMSPFIIQKLFGLSPIHFGYIALFCGLFYLAGTLINAKLIKTINIRKVSMWGVGLQTLMTIILIILTRSLHCTNLFCFLPPILLLLSGLGMFYPNLMGELLNRFSHHSGLANALVGTGIILGVSITSTIASIPKLHNTSPLVIGYGLLIMCLLFGYDQYQKHNNQ